MHNFSVQPSSPICQQNLLWWTLRLPALWSSLTSFQFLSSFRPWPCPHIALCCCAQVSPEPALPAWYLLCVWEALHVIVTLYLTCPIAYMCGLFVMNGPAATLSRDTWWWVKWSFTFYQDLFFHSNCGGRGCCWVLYQQRPEQGLRSLDLERQVAVGHLTWALGIKPWASARAGCALNHGALSPVQSWLCIKNKFMK